MAIDGIDTLIDQFESTRKLINDICCNFELASLIIFINGSLRTLSTQTGDKKTNTRGKDVQGLILPDVFSVLQFPWDCKQIL